MVVLVLIIAIFIAIADQGFKFLVVKNLKPIGNFNFIDGFLKFTYVENRGAAFGILQNQQWIFLIFAVVFVFFAIYLVNKKSNDKFFCIIIALIIGGGLGNFIDRLTRGYVVDYISVSFFPPVFNFADCCVSVGAVLFVIYVILCFRKGEDIF